MENSILQEIMRAIERGDEHSIAFPPDAFILTDSEGRTLLMRAASEGLAAVVQYLLDTGYRPSRQGDSADLSATDPATLIENLEQAFDDIARITADINMTDYRGMTALLHAAAAGRRDIVEQLLKAGADPSIQTFSGNTYEQLLNSAASAIPVWENPASPEAPDPREEHAQAYAKRIQDNPYYDFSYAQTERSRLDKENCAISLREAADQEKAPVNQETALCIQNIVDENYEYDAIEWDNIDYAHIARYLIDAKNEVPVSLAGNAFPFLVELFGRMAGINPNWAAACITRFTLTPFYGIMNDSAWDPRVMLNGTVLIRNHHRVMGLAYKSTMLFCEDDHATFLDEIRNLGDAVWMISEKEGYVQHLRDPADLNRNGNNVLGITDLDALDGTVLLAHSRLKPLVDDSRGGIAFRLFSDGINIYSVTRQDDDLDFACDSLALLNENMDQEPIADVVCPSVSKPWWSTDLETREQNREQATIRDFQYLTRVLEDHFENYCIEAEGDYPHLEGIGRVKVPLYAGRSIYELMLANLKRATRSELSRQFTWQPNIFADAGNKIHGYTGAYERDDADQTVDYPVLLYFNLSNVDEISNFKSLPEKMLENDQLDDLLDDYSLPPLSEAIDKGVARLTISIPEDMDTLGEYVDLAIGMEEFVSRLEELYAAYEEDDCEAFLEELFDNISSQLVRLELSMERGVMLNLNEFGQALSALLEDQGGDMVIDSTVTIDLPTMGVEQTFCDGEFDSGNMG